jgi:hypothetical protein
MHRVAFLQLIKNTSPQSLLRQPGLSVINPEDGSSVFLRNSGNNRQTKIIKSGKIHFVKKQDIGDNTGLIMINIFCEMFSDVVHI